MDHLRSNSATDLPAAAPVVSESASASSVNTRAQLSQLRDLIEKSAELLPLPGPITSFAFLNTLQALENRNFDEGMAIGSRLYGAEPYLPEEKYREHLARGRIQLDDLAAALREDLGPEADEPLGTVGTLGTRFDLRLMMLREASPTAPAEELRWFVAETDALAKFCADVAPEAREAYIEATRTWVRESAASAEASRWRGDEFVQPFQDALSLPEPEQAAACEELTLQVLWRLCSTNVRKVPLPVSKAVRRVRHRDVLKDATGEDIDLLVHEELIRYCAAFTDQGFAGWPLPHRKQGFLRAYCRLNSRASGPATHWTRGLAEEAQRLQDSRIDALESICESLTILGVEESEWGDYLSATLLALRGWAGMLWQMETRPDRVPLPVAAGTLVEFVAVRLILERLALEHVARRTLKYTGPLSNLRQAIPAPPARAATSVEQRTFLVFQLAQRMGWLPPLLAHLSRVEWTALVAEIESFSELERRRLMHLAFERQLHTRALDALAVYGRRTSARVKKPLFQVVTCIDAREESFRRHIEEVAPRAETLAAAGFFGVPIYYRGASDAHFATLCPIVVRPKHWVVEDVVYTLGQSHRRRAKARRALGTASHHLHVGSRSIAGGALLTATFGVLATVPLVARVLFPRTTARLRRMTSSILQTPTTTRLRLERTEPEPGPEGGHIGFTVDEMAELSERILRDIGLTSGFARLVIFMGHGSFSVNNPHKSVYDCGACTGNAGSANARALAAMLNDRRVRDILHDHGLRIPHETVFLGGLHNTCDDTVTFFDLDLLPATHYGDIAEVEQILAEACDRNAHERCRRFDSAPLDLTFAAAHRHVEGRSQDLAQARPEFGNASNALTIVGRRQRTRGLYLDRRAFLMSYDPTQDDEEGHTLERILNAVVPVTEGINMQYTLSYVDSTGWGCGSKLPHNVTSLLGVMDGALSDLRPGIPWQGVEIHEPVRLMFVFETTPEVMKKIISRNETIGRILRNEWARMAVLSPAAGQIHIYRDGEFYEYLPSSARLPYAASSIDWYQGHREHLSFAEIRERSAADTNAANESEPCLTTS